MQKNPYTNRRHEAGQKETLNMKLRLSGDHVIDTDDYRREGLRVAILAMSGHGKSNVATDVVENVLDQRVKR
jgi:hypothetical protein